MFKCRAHLQLDIDFHERLIEEIWTIFQLGYTGTRVGHEIGHTFIEHSINPDGLPYFSKPAEDCVQNQYLKTCNEYYEGEVSIK